MKILTKGGESHRHESGGEGVIPIEDEEVQTRQGVEVYKFNTGWKF